MKKDTLVWLVLIVIAGGWIAYRTLNGDMGRSYSKQVEGKTVSANPNDPAATFSTPRTLGLWAAALFTLGIYSFLYRDNPFYKVAEAILVGVSAAYWMVVGFWSVLVPNLVAKLLPQMTQNWALPGAEPDLNLWYLIPLTLGIFMLWRLMPAGAWISRWSLAFIIGTTAGIRMVGFLSADFLSQIGSSIVPLVVREGGKYVFWPSVFNIIVVVGVLCGLVYFFFSFEHRGVMGQLSRVGIWFLMITFGASFGYTVMGRIALFAIRLEFLFDDWLWLIDPQHRRDMVAAALINWWW